MRRLVLKLHFALALVLAADQVDAWEYAEVTNEFEGTTAYILEVKSSVTVTGFDGDQHAPVLQLRCDRQRGPAIFSMRFFQFLESTTVRAGLGPVTAIAAPLARMRVWVDGQEDDRIIWEWSPDQSLQGMNSLRARRIARALECYLPTHRESKRNLTKKARTQGPGFQVPDCGRSLAVQLGLQ